MGIWAESDGLTLDVRLSETDFARMSMGSRQRVNKSFREWMYDGVIGKCRDHHIIKGVAYLKNARN